MIDIKVLGSGCAKCKATVQLIEAAAKSEHVSITLEKVEAMEKIIGYGVMSTPAVVLGGNVVHTGGVPSREKVIGWLRGDKVSPPVPSANPAS
jgi:small redox-active disulfide protein 2